MRSAGALITSLPSQAFVPFKLVKMPNGYVGVEVSYNDETTVRGHVST
jgi:hypothetical protein